MVSHLLFSFDFGTAEDESEPLDERNNKERHSVKSAIDRPIRKGMGKDRYDNETSSLDIQSQTDTKYETELAEIGRLDVLRLESGLQWKHIVIGRGARKINSHPYLWIDRSRIINLKNGCYMETEGDSFDNSSFHKQRKEIVTYEDNEKRDGVLSFFSINEANNAVEFKKELKIETGDRSPIYQWRLFRDYNDEHIFMVKETCVLVVSTQTGEVGKITFDKREMESCCFKVSPNGQCIVFVYQLYDTTSANVEKYEIAKGDWKGEVVTSWQMGEEVCRPSEYHSAGVGGIRFIDEWKIEVKCCRKKISEYRMVDLKDGSNEEIEKNKDPSISPNELYEVQFNEKKGEKRATIQIEGPDSVVIEEVDSSPWHEFRWINDDKFIDYFDVYEWMFKKKSYSWRDQDKKMSRVFSVSKNRFMFSLVTNVKCSEVFESEEISYFIFYDNGDRFMYYVLGSFNSAK